MRITIFCKNGPPHQNRWGHYFESGLLKHGITPNWGPADAKQTKVDCDIAVIWGHKKTHIINAQKEKGLPYIVMERGYFGDRYVYTSVGYNGLNGTADFKNKNSPSSRWEQHGVPVGEWKTGGDYILLLGQVAGDAAVRMGETLPNWYAKVVGHIRAKTKMPIYFRPHPLARQKFDVHHTKTISGNLQDAFAKAFCAVAYSSNSLTDAVIAGVPVFAFSKIAMAYPLACHDIASILAPIRPAREQWLYDLAFAQWTWKEIANGDAWEHLKP